MNYPQGGVRAVLGKLWSFAESPLTWGAIAVLGGAVGLLSLKWLFLASWGLLVAVVKKTNFFEGKSTPRRIAGNVFLSLIIGVGFLLLSRVLPKPKQSPTADEIAAEIIERLPQPAGAVPAVDRKSEPTKPESGQYPRASDIAEQVIRRIPQIVASQHQNGSNVTSLKGRTKQLSQDILAFWVEQAKSRPFLVRRPGGDYQDEVAVLQRQERQYEDSLKAAFVGRFRQKLDRLFDDLESEYVDRLPTEIRLVKDAKEICRSPAIDEITPGVCAIRLAALAERLP